MMMCGNTANRRISQNKMLAKNKSENLKKKKLLIKMFIKQDEHELSRYKSVLKSYFN